MDEHIAAIFLLDKAIALLSVKPLHSIEDIRPANNFANKTRVHSGQNNTQRTFASTICNALTHNGRSSQSLKSRGNRG
jgi:hypothetical protein